MQDRMERTSSPSASGVVNGYVSYEKLLVNFRADAVPQFLSGLKNRCKNMVGPAATTFDKYTRYLNGL